MNRGIKRIVCYVYMHMQCIDMRRVQSIKIYLFFISTMKQKLFEKKCIHDVDCSEYEKNRNEQFKNVLEHKL